MSKNPSKMRNDPDSPPAPLPFVYVNGMVGEDIPGDVLHVRINDGIAEIPGSMFANHQCIKSVFLPNSVHSLGDYCFYNCVGLEDINIPASVTRIGINAFSNCTSLCNVQFAELGASIEIFSASFCHSTNIKLPDRIQSIRCSVQNHIPKVSLPFVYLDGMIREDIPGDVIHIKISDGVTRIDESMFDNLDMVYVTIPDSVTILDDYAFAHNRFIKSIVLPDSIEYLGDYCFYKCTGLEDINIPASVTRIGKAAFSNCTSLRKVQFAKEGASLEILSAAFYNCNQLRTIKLPDRIEFIHFCVFQNCKSLESIKLPLSVKHIGISAFRGCKSLKNIEFPKHLATIRKRAFLLCKSLPKVNIPDSVQRIDFGAFGSCHKLTVVYLPVNTDLHILQHAFMFCRSLFFLRFTKPGITHDEIAAMVAKVNASDNSDNNNNNNINNNIRFDINGNLRIMDNIPFVLLPQLIQAEKKPRQCASMTSLIFLHLRDNLDKLFEETAITCRKRKRNTLL
jgi:hypothetical protein